MNALVLNANGDLAYKEVVDPVVGDDECLIAVKYAGVCSSDFHRAYDKWAYFYPLIMGHEFAGEILKIGSRVSKYSPGDRVVIFPLIPCKTCEFCLNKQYAQCTNYSYYGSRQNGGFAQLVSVKEWNLLKLPNDISFERAAVIEPISVAFHAISKAEIKSNQKIAILGAGFIGLVTAFILSKTCNAHDIILIDLDKNKLNFAAQYGFSTICTQDNSSWDEILIKSGGVEIVFEMCGAVQTFKHSLHIVKSHGQVIWVGNVTGDMLFEKKLISSILRKELKIKGSWNSSFTHDDSDDWHKALNYARESNELDKLLTHIVSLSDGANFFETTTRQSHNTPIIKAVLKP